MTEYFLEPANFSDYRDFLKYRFDNLKAANPKFSLQHCANRSGISKSLLQFIFRKKRHLSLDKMPKLAGSLKLNVTEEYYLYLMLCKNSSSNPEIQSHFEKILSRVRHEFVKISSVEPKRSTTNNKDLYLEYLFMMIQALARLDQFEEDPAWIVRNLNVPNISETKVIQALRELEEKKFLIRNQDGRLVPPEQTLWRPDPYDPSGQNVFVKGAECIAELMQNPEIYRPSVYMHMSLTFDEKNLALAEKMMIELHHKLSGLAKESVKPSAVVQFGNFMLTVARLR